MKKINFSILAIIMGVAVFFTIRAQGAGPNMTIKRVDDAIEIQGRDLVDFLGKPISKMRLHVWKSGKFTPAPYQIDERDKKDEWVFTEGPEKTIDDDNGKLDDNDEMAFMAHDLGDEAPGGAKPDGAKSCYKISALDPVDNGAGYAYLCDFDFPPSPSKIDYASHEVKVGMMWMMGTTYKIGTGTEDSYFDIISLKKADDKWGPDILDRYKTRGHGIPIPGLETISEANAKAMPVGWIDGPIRVIRKSKGYLKIAWKIKIKMEGSSQNIYYPRWFVVPLKFKLPPLPKVLMKNFYLTSTLDFNRNVYGSKYYDAINTKGFLIDGKMSDEEKNLNKTDSHSWFTLIGPRSGVFVRFVLPSNMSRYISTPTYYVDNEEKPDPPERNPGQSNFGFVLSNFTELPSGNYKYYAYFYFPEMLKWSNHHQILDIIDKPLQVKLSKVN